MATVQFVSDALLVLFWIARNSSELVKGRLTTAGDEVRCRHSHRPRTGYARVKSSVDRRRGIFGDAGDKNQPLLPPPARKPGCTFLRRTMDLDCRPSSLAGMA